MRIEVVSAKTSAAFLMILLATCAAPPPPVKVEQPKPDPTTQADYTRDIEELANLVKQVRELLKQGQSDKAAAVIKEAEPVQARLLTAPKPTLPAMAAASDLDDLYAHMLLSNRHDGWARMLFQKNVARWKAWRPRTEETERRLKQAQDGIAACDRSLSR